MNEAIKTTAKQRVALVTGASGFVGRHLTRRLVGEGWKVHVLVRPESVLPKEHEFEHVINHVHDGSTESMVNCVKLSTPDVVFHLGSFFLAQHSADDIPALIRSNVLFGTQLLEAMHVSQVKGLVNTGTSWQHYSNDAYNPVCLYAATKQAFESILEYYVQACGIKAITLKLFDTYGPDDPRPKLFRLLNKAATTNDPLDMSAGKQLIDLVHIDDVVEAYLIAAQRLREDEVKQHESYAISSGQPLPLRELVELYAKVTQKQINVNWGARPYRNREVMVPWDWGAILPEWTPQIALRDGLSDLDSHLLNKKLTNIK